MPEGVGGAARSPPGPRGGAEGGVRREAPKGARSLGPRARQRARGVFQIPDKAEGDLAKIPAEKTQKICILLLKLHTINTIHNFYATVTNNHQRVVITTFKPATDLILHYFTISCTKSQEFQKFTHQIVIVYESYRICKLSE